MKNFSKINIIAIICAFVAPVAFGANTAEMDSSCLLTDMLAHKRNDEDILGYKNYPPANYIPQEVVLPKVGESKFRPAVAKLRRGDTAIFKASYENANRETRRALFFNYLKQAGGSISADYGGGAAAFDLPERRFRLGEYLGAGNSAHTFRLADEPKKKIRIAYVPLEFTELSLTFGTIDYFNMHALVKAEPVDVIEIYEVRPSYVIAEYVDGDLGSEKFLEEMDQKYPGTFDRKRSLINKYENPETAKKYNLLIEALLGAKILEERADGVIEDVRATNDRQFIWSDAKARWRLNDWEFDKNAINQLRRRS